MEVLGISLVTNLAAGHQRRAAQPRGGPRGRQGRGDPDGRPARPDRAGGSDRCACWSPAPPEASAGSSPSGLADRGHEVVGLDRVPAPEGIDVPVAHRATAPTRTPWPRSSPSRALDGVVHLAGHPTRPPCPTRSRPTRSPRPRCSTRWSSTASPVRLRLLQPRGRPDAAAGDLVLTVDTRPRPGHVLRRRQGRRRGADEPVRRPLRPRRRRLPDRLVPRAAADRPQPVDLAVPRRLRADGRGGADRPRARVRRALRHLAPTPAPGGTSSPAGALGYEPQDDAEEFAAADRRRGPRTRSRRRTSAGRSRAEEFHRPALRAGLDLECTPGLTLVRHDA